MPRTFKPVSAFLHIIAFNIPYPADYGGAIDVFEKIKALHAQGVQVHLHCFSYNRPPALELEKYCASVRYYLRKTGLRGLSGRIPYIVHSRRDQSLLQILSEDNYPILAEGIHCAYHLFKNPNAAVLVPRWPHRKVFIRTHNIEADYYARMAQGASALMQKVYYRMESHLLQGWETKVATSGIPLLSITEADAAYFRNKGAQTTYLAPFTHERGNDAGEGGKIGRGDYILYHGDLSIKDNEQALRWLVTEIKGKGQTNLDWVVAGRNPSKALQQWLEEVNSIHLESNPSAERMEALIEDAYIHLIHSFNPSGIKIKLIHALRKGKHVIAYEPLIKDTGLESTCHAANSPTDFIRQIDYLSEVPFTQLDSQKRKQILEAGYNNHTNARTLVDML